MATYIGKIGVAPTFFDKIAEAVLTERSDERHHSNSATFDPNDAPDWQLRDLGFKDGRPTRQSLRQQRDR